MGAAGMMAPMYGPDTARIETRGEVCRGGLGRVEQQEKREELGKCEHVDVKCADWDSGRIRRQDWSVANECDFSWTCS
jgi:hypothetical protein